MADATSTTTGADLAGGVGEGGNGGAPTEPTTEELKTKAEAETKRANEAHKLLRKRDQDFRGLQERLDKLEQERAAQRAQTQGTTSAASDDAEPNAEENYVEWLKWDRRQLEKRLAQSDAQRRAETEAQNLNTFAMTSEAAARAEIPDYQPAVEFLIEDYRKELKLTGELDLAVDDALADKNPQTRDNISRVMAERGISEREAAEDLVVRAAFEYRRQRAVRAAARHGGNPAKSAYELAKHRGWKGAQGTRTMAVVDGAVKEMERRRKLDAGTQTLGGIHEGGEPHDTRVYTRAELDEMRLKNPAEFRRVSREIAAQLDAHPEQTADILNRSIGR